MRCWLRKGESQMQCRRAYVHMLHLLRFVVVPFTYSSTNKRNLYLEITHNTTLWCFMLCDGVFQGFDFFLHQDDTSDENNSHRGQKSNYGEQQSSSSVRLCLARLFRRHPEYSGLSIRSKKDVFFSDLFRFWSVSFRFYKAVFASYDHEHSTDNRSCYNLSSLLIVISSWCELT